MSFGAQAPVPSADAGSDAKDDLPFDTATVIDICRRNDVAMVGVVGSMARGEATDGSDIDLLVRFARPKSLVGVIGLEQQLTAALGREVDLLTEAALSPYLRERILRDLRVMYDAR
jgi:predicted nucleotidyltransferase